MRILKKIIIFPIFVVLVLIKTLLDLIIKAECWVAGVGFLLLATLAVLAIIKQQWLQFGFFAVLAGLGLVILFLSANVQVLIEDGMEKLKQ